MNVSSRLVSGWGEKTVGFASAAGAIMMEYAPVIARIRRASSRPTVAILDNRNVTPEALEKSTTSPRRTSVRSQVHVAHAAVDREAIDSGVDDALLRWEGDAYEGASWSVRILLYMGLLNVLISIFFFIQRISQAGRKPFIGLVRREPAPFLSRCKLHGQVFGMPIPRETHEESLFAM